MCIPECSLALFFFFFAFLMPSARADGKGWGEGSICDGDVGLAARDGVSRMLVLVLMRLKRFLRPQASLTREKTAGRAVVWRLENVMCSMCRMSWSLICDASRLLDPWLVDSMCLSPSCSVQGAKLAGETHK